MCTIVGLRWFKVFSVFNPPEGGATSQFVRIRCLRVGIGIGIKDDTRVPLNPYQRETSHHIPHIVASSPLCCVAPTWEDV